MTIEDWQRVRDAMLRYLDDDTVLSLQLLTLTSEEVPALVRLGRRCAALQRDIQELAVLLQNFITAAQAFQTGWPDVRVEAIQLVERGADDAGA